MGKVRLECPHCGKAIRVSDTAEKARCPRCKKVIKVASALAEARGKKPAEGAAEKAEAQAPKPPAGAPEKQPEEKPGEKAKEETAEVAPPPKKASKRSSRRLKGAAKAPPKAAPTVGGIQSWMIVAGVSVLIFVLLFLFYLQWWAALMIASAIGVYADASLCRITRVGPSSRGSPLGPTIWGLIAFVLVVGPAVYILLRRKLLANSQEDIADADATNEDLEETGQVRAPSLASPGVVLVLAGVIGLGIMSQKPEWLTVKLGSKFSNTSKKIGGQNKRDMFDSKKPFHVGIDARKALDEEEYKTLTYVVFPKGGDEEPPVVQGEVTWDEEVADAGRKRIWHWTVQVDEPGTYVLKVMRTSGKQFGDQKEFRIRSVK